MKIVADIVMMKFGDDPLPPSFLLFPVAENHSPYLTSWSILFSKSESISFNSQLILNISVIPILLTHECVLSNLGYPRHYYCNICFCKCKNK